jgi:hypothetical protein
MRGAWFLQSLFIQITVTSQRRAKTFQSDNVFVECYAFRTSLSNDFRMGIEVGITFGNDLLTIAIMANNKSITIWSWPANVNVIWSFAYNNDLHPSAAHKRRGALLGNRAPRDK